MIFIHNIRLLICILSFFFISCLSVREKKQKVDGVFIEKCYEGAPVNLSDKIYIYFAGGFNDTLLIKQSGKNIIKKFLKSEETTSYTGFCLIMNRNKTKKIEIVSINDNRKIKLELIKGYQTIVIHKYSNEWFVSYRNTYPMFE